MEPLKVPKKVNRHILKALDFLQASRTDYVSVEAIQDRVKWTLRKTKPVENLEYVVMEALNNQTELGILSRSGSMYAMALGLPSLHSKKVNRHVLKALNYLQTSKTDFVSIEAIQDRVKQSLRYTKPVSNLEELVRDCLRNQTELGIVSRSGSSKYAMTLLFQGPRSMKNEDYTEKNRVCLMLK
ncbi:hypothetical protein KR054_004450 [Drosophila jambulina]|nr:hypothetical protein KR054_004450 [Drosophila jambulina]